METLAEIYKKHSGGTKFNDKNSVHSYVPVYEELLAPYRMKIDGKFIEIGLFDGASFEMWREFMCGDVYGIDIDEQPHGGLADLRPTLKKYPDRAFLCDATDHKAVDEIFPGYLWDVVIDDAAHSIEQQLAIFNVWKDRLAPGGILVTEDIQDLDATRDEFLSRGFEIMDRRKVKNRYDDVLAVWRK